MTADPTDSTHVPRRTLLRAAGTATAGGLLSAVGAAARPLPADRHAPHAPPGRADASLAVFPQSVASGDPTPTGAVVWTRVAPDAHRSDAVVALDVARGPDFRDPVATWTLDADETGPERDYTVKVDLDGELRPDRTYRYRFRHDGAASPVGRFRTLPRPGAAPDRVRVGVFSCQDYRAGYYNAYRCALADDLDFVLHLGDFVYEYAGGPVGGGGRRVDLPSGGAVAMGLDDYRHLHRTYRSDPALRAAMERYPFVVTWDDHEIVNNRYWDYAEDRPYAGSGDHPRNDDAAFMARLFAAGIRAWCEYTPARVRFRPDADSLLDSLGLWRSVRVGDLVEFLVTDERLFRSDPPARGWHDAREAADRGEGRTVLGAEQRGWFLDALDGAATTWTAWANEVVQMRFELELGNRVLVNADAWDGYEGERRRIVRRARAGTENFVTLTGDMHAALAGYVQETYPEERRADDPVGVEFVTPAVTSANLAAEFDLPPALTRSGHVESAVRAANPHVAFFDGRHWGYSVVEFTPSRCSFAAYGVAKDRPLADPSRTTLARFDVPAGRVALRR